MQLPGFTTTTKLPNYTKDSLVARYGDSRPGSKVESNEHVDAAQLIKETLTLESQYKGLIGEDCRNIEKDVPGLLVVDGPTFKGGGFANEEAILKYDPASKQTKAFVDTTSQGANRTVLSHSFEDGNEIFQRSVKSDKGNYELKVICPSTGQPIQVEDSFRPNGQIHSNSSGSLVMFDEPVAPKPEPAAPKGMAGLYPTAAARPEKMGPSINDVGKLTGESSNVATTVAMFKEQFPEAMIYPAERQPGDDRVIMDIRYVLHGEDRENKELHQFLDTERSRVIQYWYDR